MHLDPDRRQWHDGTIGDLRHVLRAGDELVVNDAATLPAALRGETAEGGGLEVRLVERRADGSWLAVLFGRGDWRIRTENRAAPPLLRPGRRIRFPGLTAAVRTVDPASPRLVTLLF